MSAFVFILILLFAESGGAAPSGSGWESFLHFWETYMNRPGFEVWRFFNLLVFVLIIGYLLKKPLSDAFKQKREAIRADLIRAEEEKQAAIARLTEAEARLARLDSEKTRAITDAKSEAAAERQRIDSEAENEISRLKGQAANEIKRKTQQANLRLRRHSAEESIRLAEEKIRNAMNAQKDAELVKSNIQSIGGFN